MVNDAQYLRKQAAHCRRLAKGLFSEEIAVELLKIGAELEVEAVQIETAQRQHRRQPTV
jgi:hypothetical protein